MPTPRLDRIEEGDVQLEIDVNCERSSPKSLGVELVTGDEREAAMDGLSCFVGFHVMDNVSNDLSSTGNARRNGRSCSECR